MFSADVLLWSPSNKIMIYFCHSQGIYLPSVCVFTFLLYHVEPKQSLSFKTTLDMLFIFLTLNYSDAQLTRR